MRSRGISYYPLADVQGSTISLVNRSGVEVNHDAYDPYGADRGKTETVTYPLQYTGGQLDTTGLYHLGARYYDPGIGLVLIPELQVGEVLPHGYSSLGAVTGVYETCS